MLIAYLHHILLFHYDINLRGANDQILDYSSYTPKSWKTCEFLGCKVQSNNRWKVLAFWRIPTFFSKWNQVLGILNWGSISSTYSWQIWIICISMLMLLIRPNWWFYVRLLGQTFQANLSNYFEKFGSYPLISDMFLFLLFTNFWDLRQR